MPFDPTIALKVQVPKFSSPLDDYAKFMSLKDMVDQRRVRDLQVRRLELQEEQDRREQEELRNVTDLLRTNPKASPEQIFGVSPNKGPGLVRGLYEAGKAQFEARKSQADFAESERQRGRTVQKEMVDQMRSLLELPEAARPAAYQKMLQSNLARGIVPPEAADQPMPTNEEIWQQYAQYHGAMATEDLREKIASGARAREKEARDVALFNPQYSTAQANAQIAQLKLLGKEPIQPAQQAQLDISGRLDSPDKIAVALSDPNLPPYKRTQLEQARERMIQQRVLTAPQNMPMSPEVFQQRKDLQTTQVPGAAAVKSKSLSLKNLEDSLTSYEAELDRIGPVLPFQTEKGAKLQSLFTDLQMQTKNLYELGAITGPDLELLNKALTDPTGIPANWAGKNALLEQLKVMKSVVRRSKNNLTETYGPGSDSSSPPAGGGTGGKKSDPLRIR